MRVEAFQPIEVEDEENDLLDALVSAHYLALKMRMLIQEDRPFEGREATGLLADALTEWARLVENDQFPGPERPEIPSVLTILDFPKH
jgi:hypothetical protein